MGFASVLGFLAVVAGALVLRLRGRGAAAATLIVGLVLTCVASGVIDGRDAIHSWSVGVLVGLPVLIGFAAAYERASRRAEQNAPRGS